MRISERFIQQHYAVTRRFFLQLSAAGLTGASLSSTAFSESALIPTLDELKSKLEYLTKDEDFINYGRGNPPPYKAPLEKRRAVGLIPETWRLEVFTDPESDAQIENPLLIEKGTALDWQGLMTLAEKHTVRYLHVMSCTNGHAPCGMGLWEGVPLREIIWMTRPTKNIRRVFYYGYHNDDPKQRFQSSLSLGRVLEDPPGELPVILCYKLNGRWLSPIRGGPVRMLVPGLYGNKSVKWLQRIVLTNNYKINDTYALWNNDTESHLKTWARFIYTPETIKAGQVIPITGLAQVGMSGLKKAQYWLHPHDQPLPDNDPYFTTADWKDAEILPPPDHWGGDLPEDRLPSIPHQFDSETGAPHQWPLRDTTAHWAAALTNIKPGRYTLRCRTIDANGVAQPMPRPYNKSGYNAIQKTELTVEA